ncbi:MAG: TIGR02996 domain-containing protein [Planctomycetes bacterium]|nr:TIGR02996 domain-containing protein [Planctomycetota bacterium]
MLLLDHLAFLDKIRENPADLAAWLVYADWLDEQDDPTGTFVRFSLDFTAGRVPVRAHSGHVKRLHALAARAHAETRGLMGVYRTGLPLRLQVCETALVGHERARDMFGYPRTFVFVAVLSGRLVRGMWLRAEDETWRPDRPVLGMALDRKAIDIVDAGTTSGTVSLYYLNHHKIPDGTILVEGPPPELDVLA